MNTSLSLFNRQIADWFSETYGEPTDIQQQAWPRIANKEHLLITAPTGSGKTLTAFLWAINQFVTGELDTGATRVLYISPLKALNNDIERNLNMPLAALRARAEAAGQPFPNIRVQTRSGDTEQIERRRMLRHPPEILITTPESLNILLTSKSGEGMLRHIKTVILDEIHGVVTDKRGVYLMSAIERLVPLSGEFQRISLSATVKPLDRIAEFVGGFERLSGNQFRKRDVATLQSFANKTYDVTVRYPAAAANRPVEEKIWDSLVDDFVEKIRGNTSTLLFVNSRTLAETLTHKINTAANETLAYAHHGSLSREIRLNVEQRLKNGELAAIVATGTLEMGIDIGALDEVILVQAPAGIASAIQKIGRAGHGVGEVSRCTIYPTHPLDFIESAVLGKAILDADIEPIQTVECPLDVLAQVIISMTSTRVWDLQDLFIELRRSTAYHVLSQDQFDLMINMLNGRYGENRIRELRPKVIVDQIHQTIEARRGSTMALYLSGGVIPDRGYFQLRLQDSNSRIGELDEEFVWEAYVGKTFAFGTQHWQIKKITHNDVIVVPASPSAIAPPFWISEGMNRSFHYAERIGQFLEHADALLQTPQFRTELMQHHHLEPLISDALIELLLKQQLHTQTPLPHRHHVLVEKIQQAAGYSSGYQIVIHTGWGSRVNRPLALAMEAAWEDLWDERPEIFVTDQCLVMQLMAEVDSNQILGMVQSKDIERLLRKRLEGSGFFGARFRENAGRSLLLSKGKFNERKPLWMSRLQSQKLLDVVLKYEDFPILLETWRACLQDEFDLPNLRRVLDELNAGEIQVSEVNTKLPSPFAQTVAYNQISEYMYASDKPNASVASNLSSNLLETLVFQPALRPAIPAHIVHEFVIRRQRTLAGYEPQSATDWVEWVKERTLIPQGEWPIVDGERLEIFDGLSSLVNNGQSFITATEDLERVRQQLMKVSPTLLSNWLQYYGPMTLQKITATLGTSKVETTAALSRLLGDNTLIFGDLVVDRSVDQSVDKRVDKKVDYYCDAANFEILLRFVRQAARVNFEAKGLVELTPFLYRWQTRQLSKQMQSSVEAEDSLASLIDILQCFPQAASAWEAHILPSRIPDYQSQTLDLMMQSGSVCWVGSNPKQIQFCFADNLSMLQNSPAENTLFADSFSRYDFLTLLDKTGLPAAELSERLWQEVWQGKVSNDTFSALRTGISQGFKSIDTQPSPSPRSRRAGFRNWKRKIPFAGDWFLPRYSEDIGDSIEQEEQNKERVRLLTDRYGILFRELLQDESDAFKWSALFRSMRLMELSGELYSGYFFKDIPGPQFISPAALAALTNSQSPQNFWMNATDPISCCGYAFGKGMFRKDGLYEGEQSKQETGPALPRRVIGNYLVYQQSRLALVVEQLGKKLNFLIPPDHPDLQECLVLFHHLLGRSNSPIGKIVLHEINNEPATSSPYLAAFGQTFDIVRDHKSVYLQKRFGVMNETAATDPS
ncbi:MAG: ATP-dependent Lhr-like helicase [Candidatus Azotimanducaceae bacterium]|jgi:ATP-dependent Lhr-like helicase